MITVHVANESLYLLFTTLPYTFRCLIHRTAVTCSFQFKVFVVLWKHISDSSMLKFMSKFLVTEFYCKILFYVGFAGAK